MIKFFKMILEFIVGVFSQAKQVPAPKEKNPNAKVLGLDVARYQDGMGMDEWNIAYRMGYRFVFAKATDGKSSTDYMHRVHRKLAKEAGLLFGSYHYFRFGYDAKEQAEHFMNTCGGVHPGELPMVGDFEWDRYTANGRYGEGKRMDDYATDMAYEFLTEVERLSGVTPIVYTNAYFWQENPKNAGRFLKFKCWIPAYNTVIERVRVPKPWSALTIWQDSESLSIGKVQEIDTNVFVGDGDDLLQLTRKK